MAGGQWLSISDGFSRTARTVSRNSAASLSSMMRASLAVVIDIIVAVLTSSVSGGDRSTGRAVPTARIHVCGGLMTAENDEMPNIPRFDILQHHRIRQHTTVLPTVVHLHSEFVTIVGGVNLKNGGMYRGLRGISKLRLRDSTRCQGH